MADLGRGLAGPTPSECLFHFETHVILSPQPISFNSLTSTLHRVLEGYW